MTLIKQKDYVTIVIAYRKKINWLINLNYKMIKLINAIFVKNNYIKVINVIMEDAKIALINSKRLKEKI